MSAYYIHLKVAPYVAEFCTHHFGCEGGAVEIPSNTPEQKLFRTFLEKQSAQAEVCRDYNMSIKIPYTKDKDPRVYNYLSPHVKELLSKSLEKMVYWNMWTELSGFANMKINKTDLIMAWMERHGIKDTDENVEMMRKRFYRARKVYEKAGVALG
jgi:hypothetical protein